MVTSAISQRHRPLHVPTITLTPACYASAHVTAQHPRVITTITHVLHHPTSHHTTTCHPLQSHTFGITSMSHHTTTCHPLPVTINYPFPMEHNPTITINFILQIIYKSMSLSSTIPSLPFPPGIQFPSVSDLKTVLAGLCPVTHSPDNGG